MFYQRNLLRHVEAIHRLLPAFGAQADMNFSTLGVTIKARGRTLHLTPQFACEVNGRTFYSPRLLKEVNGFIGWLPYFNKQWSIGSGKRAFKSFCAIHNIRTPQVWTSPKEAETGYLIKPLSGSFGQDFHGPFRAGDSRVSGVEYSADRAYCEEFIEGRALKAWFWDNRLTCVEIQNPRQVVGDGGHSLRELIDDLRPRQLEADAWRTKVDWANIEQFCWFQGFELDEIVSEERVVDIEFRFGAFLAMASNANSNVLGTDSMRGICTELAQAGPVFWGAISEDIRLATAYTVDAVIDREGKVWFLELNCNPAMHPDIYHYMFEGFFGPSSGKAGGHEAQFAYEGPQEAAVNSSPWA